MSVLVFFFADLTVPAAVCLALSGWASCASVLYLTHDADLAAVDPRPVLRRVHQRAVHTGHDVAWTAASVRHELTPYAAPVWCTAYRAREVARDVAALVLLLTTSPKGATR